MVNELCLDLLGTSFSITTDADEAHLEKVLNQYKAAINKTQSIAGLKDPLNVAVLTGFMLCDEINRLKQKIDSSTNESEIGTEAATAGNFVGGSDETASDEALEIAVRTRRLIALLEQEINESPGSNNDN